MNSLKEKPCRESPFWHKNKRQLFLEVTFFRTPEVEALCLFVLPVFFFVCREPLLAGVRAGLPVPEGNEANSGTLKHATAGFCRTEQPKEVPKLF